MVLSRDRTASHRIQSHPLDHPVIARFRARLPEYQIGLSLDNVLLLHLMLVWTRMVGILMVALAVCLEIGVRMTQ